MEKANHNLNIISLHKSIHQPGSPMTHPSDNWLVLGHFDSLSLTSIPSDPKQHMLEQIWDNLSNPKKFCSSSGSDEQELLGLYRHALYLLPDAKNSEGNQNQEKLPFMFITHIRKSSGCTGPDSAQLIAATVRMVMENAKDVPFQCYSTLCLSDLILITFSDSLQTLMNTVKTLFTCPYIGDTYTYCCISKTALSAPDTHNLSRKDQIPLVSMRLAVRSTKKAQETLQSWADLLSKEKDTTAKKMVTAVQQAYFVTGTADLNILLQDVSSYDFIRFFQFILHQGKPKFWESFDDMVTRLGVLFKPDPPPDSDVQSANELCKAHCKLNDQEEIRNPEENFLYDAFFAENRKLRQALRGKQDKQDSWKKPFFELINSLIYLSKNRMLDQLCYVLLSSVQGFGVKLREPGKNSLPVEDIYTFVEQLAFVKEHIIRMESQLVLHPEARPVLFSLPVNTIESYLAFIDLCAHFLQIEDQEKEQKKFFFLIVPCLCEMVSIQSLLYSKNESNHLLYIRIPLALCYKPKDVALALAHEIGHYSGEASRNRKARFATLAYCYSVLLCEELGYRLDQSAIIQKVCDKFFELVPETDQNLIQDTKTALETCCSKLLDNQVFIYELRDMSIRELEDDPVRRYQELDRLNDRYRDVLMNWSAEYVVDMMNELQMLSRECYADVAMFSLLSVSSLDYIQLIWENRDSGMGDPTPNKREISRALLIERISLVIFIARREEVDRLTQDAEKLDIQGLEIMEFISSVEIYCAALKALEEDEPLFPQAQCEIFKKIPMKESSSEDLKFHPLEVAEALLIYLQLCYDMMPQKASHTEWNVIDTLYRSLCDQSGGSDTALENIIRNYRESIIRDSLGDKPMEYSLKETLHQLHRAVSAQEDAANLLEEKFHLSLEKLKMLLDLSESQPPK